MRLSPLHRHAREPSTPATMATSSLRPRGVHPRSPVPPSWFLTTSTVSSASRVAGLLHPAADPGVHRVSARGVPARRPRSSSASPRCRSNPPKKSSPKAATRHRARCPLAVPCPTAAAPRLVPLPVPALSWWEDRERRLRGLAPSSSLVKSPAVAGEWTTRSFLGFVPLQGPAPRPEIPSPTAAAPHAFFQVSPEDRREEQTPFRTRRTAEAESGHRTVPKHVPAETTLDELVPGANRGPHDPKTVANGGQRVAMQPKLHRRGAS
jgi:hypothetical protein